MKKLLILFCCFSFGLINAQQTVDIPIIDGNDDAFEQWDQDGYVSRLVDTDSLAMGVVENPLTRCVIGLRYQSVPIPPGSTIEAAFIQFSPFKADEGIQEIDIACEENINPDAFTSEHTNIIDRDWKYQDELWEVSAWDWIANDNSRTHDMKDLVQFVIDMEGWEKDNPMVFFFKGNYINPYSYKLAASYEYGAEWYAPLLTITFTAPAGVDEEELAKALNIFPNPVLDNFTISFDDLKKGEYNISLFDLQGKKVHQIYEGMLASGDHKFEQSSTSMNLQAGIYLIQVRGEKQDVIRKIIIQ